MAERSVAEVVAGGLDRTDYDRLLRATRTHRERLVVRLGGEVGLRPREMARLRPVDVETHVVDGRIHYFVLVDDEDGGRTAYLPRSLERELDRYVRSSGVEDDDRVFDVTPRRLQMLVSDVAERAAAATGDESLRHVSSADLRRFLARDLLVARGVSPSVVLATGGWTSLSSLEPFVEEPTTAEVADALGRHGREGGDDGPRPDRRGHERPYRDALDRLDRAVVLFDGDATVAFANRRFEALTGRSALDVAGETLRELARLEAGADVEVWETVIGGESWTGDIVLEPRDGEPVHGRATIVPLHDGDGVPRWFTLTFEHVSRGAEPPEAPTVSDREDSVQSAVRSAGRALGEAATRGELLQQLCDRLAGSDAYEFAWFEGGGDERGAMPPARAGVREATLDRMGLADGAEDSTPLYDRAIRRRATETSVVDAEALDGDRSEPVTVIAVPVLDGESVYGALCVGAPGASPTEHETTELQMLGEHAGQMLTAVERKRLLLADTVLEVEFRCADERSFLVAASGELGCTLRLEGIVPVEGNTLLYYVTATGTTPDRVLEVADAAAGGARIIADHSDESLLEVTVSERALANALVECGGSVVSMVASDGEARVTGEFAPETDVREILDALAEVYPRSEFVARREVNRSALTPSDYRRSLQDRLTDKQHAVLQAAYHAGYFDWPRGSTAEELAESMDVSSPTLHNHLRRAQRKLLDSFFAEPGE